MMKLTWQLAAILVICFAVFSLELRDERTKRSEAAHRASGRRGHGKPSPYVIGLVAALCITLGLRYWNLAYGIYTGSMMCIIVPLMMLQAVFYLMKHGIAAGIRGRIASVVLLAPALVCSGVSVVHFGALLIRESRAADVASVDERIDPFVQGTERIFNPGPWPRWMSKWLQEDLFCSVYRPQVYDISHRYSRYDATFYHVGDVGVAQYDFSGTTYPGKNASKGFSFICQAERKKCSREPALRVWDNTGNRECGVDITPVVIGSTRAMVADVAWESDLFNLTRVFCSGCTMATKSGVLDGFVLDLSGLAHSPDVSNITLVTGLQILDPTIVRLVPQQGFRDWLFARPKYKLASDGIAMIACNDSSRLAVFEKRVDEHRTGTQKTDSPHTLVTSISAYSGQVSNYGAGDTYLITYHIK
jgi:hypothetical protein